jgi:SAM-dependent methyltransferase
MSENKTSGQPILSPGDIMGMASFQRSRILLTAYELGLFTVIGDSHKTSVEVSNALGTDRRATDRLMNALVAIALLTKEDDTFTNTPGAAQLLVKGKPDYMSGLMHTVNMWESWSTLTEAVRRGTSVPRPEVNDRGDGWLRAFISAMHYRATSQAPGSIAMLDLNGVMRVLDVGGGSGAYSMAFARAKEDLTAVVFDLPNVVALTQEFIESEGLLGKVTTVAGDYNTDTFPGGFDIVYLSAIIHSNSPDENNELFRKCYDALNPKGRLVVQDFIVDPSRTNPPFAAIFALNMLVGTNAGDTFTEEEVREWMHAVGLTDIIREDTPFDTTLIIGSK